MECKDQRLVETHGQQVSIDLTRMECKATLLPCQLLFSRFV